jgi:hypothetical protein
VKRLLIIGVGAIVAAGIWAAAAGSSARADAYVRVIAQRAPIHTGPGASYRELYVAERGEVFEVSERGTKGYWFRVELEDGTTGWIFGELVFPFEVVEGEDAGLFTRMWRSIRRALLGPSPVPFSDIEISFSAGILNREGVFMLRPAWLIDEYVAIEPLLGLSPQKTKDLFLGGLGLTLRMIPGAALGPYVHVGVAAVHVRPKVDNFTDEKQTLMALTSGGGFELTFKKQITVRMDFRNWTIFDPDQAFNAQEYTGGLAIFF